MENHRRETSSSGDKFSFPIATLDPDQFEFGHVATNPVSCPDSPADHLFSNGKLLPHVFPIQPPTGFSCSRSTSRTSSSSSKDYSLKSSRSNSTNSRSSSSSSARTSTSEPSEMRKLPAIDGGGSPSARRERSKGVGSSDQYRHYQYGSSRRWQLIAAVPPLPVLKHQCSRSRSAAEILERKGSKKSRGEEEKKSWFGRRILKSFVLACKECHAI